jgi:hypothetical protein
VLFKQQGETCCMTCMQESSVCAVHADVCSAC